MFSEPNKNELHFLVIRIFYILNFLLQTMPVQKEKKYEITFKNLRRREIPCLVIAVPQKNASANSSTGTLHAENKNCSKILKRLKKKLNKLTPKPVKKSKSLSYLDRKSEMISKVIKKRAYRKKSLKPEILPRNKTTKDPPKTTNVTTTDSSLTKPTKDTLIPTQDMSMPKPTTNTSSTIPTTDSLLATPTTNTTTPMNTADMSTPIPTTDMLVPQKDSSVGSVGTPKKRAYRKKVNIGVTITQITGSPISSPTKETFFGTPIITPETPIKRVYRKKLKIPAVPHNTPVLYRGTDRVQNMSLASLPFLGHSQIITVGKRGRGRPRLSLPTTIKLGSDNGEESTMSQGSDSKGSTSRRARRTLWASESDDEGEAEDQVSEYELLRQRNIEENLKKLREIFNQQGLQFEEKTSDTPKKRKSYSRVPLPPPRPRSQRIEIRKTFMPLDFSQLDEKLNMSEAAYL